MTLRRRVLMWLLVIAPVIWLLAIVAAWIATKDEIDEFFDTRQVLLAQQVLAMLPVDASSRAQTARADRADPAPPKLRDDLGRADLGDMAIAAWSMTGERLSRPDPVVVLPFEREATGFRTRRIGGVDWRIHYLVDSHAGRVVAIGIRADERSDVIRNLLLSHALPWVLLLPVLIGAIWLVLKRELRPLQMLSQDLASRRPDELQPLALAHPPADLVPLVTSMNQLFRRIDLMLEHERRLTADAAHELRTPIAALQAQWDALGLAEDEKDKARAGRNIRASIERLSRLVGQLLSLSAVEATSLRRHFVQIDWSRLIGNTIGDVLTQIERRGVDVSVEWPEEGVASFPLLGDEALLGTLLRNLLDNAIRHSQPGVRLIVRVGSESLTVIDDGPGLAPEVANRIGERFVRANGQQSSGSGIGVSIVMRIARLHGLAVRFTSAAETISPFCRGLAVEIRAASEGSPAPI